MLTRWTPIRQHKGFTIVELLIVVVVIAILASITIVAYNGIQDSAREAAVKSELSDVVKELTVFSLKSQGYPASLSDASVPETRGNTSLSYTRSDNGNDFCLTARYEDRLVFHRTADGSVRKGPCDGHSGGPSYCPDDTHVAINGFYCDGSVGGLADLNNNAVKLLANSSPIPAGAPAAYVGRQTSRDNLINAAFPVTPGDRFCMKGWVATVNSTVPHAIGLLYNNGSVNSWVALGRAYPADATGKWTKIEGCHDVPAGIVTGRVWTQNDGVNGTTAAPAWYQTAVRFWKET